MHDRRPWWIVNNMLENIWKVSEDLEITSVPEKTKTFMVESQSNWKKKSYAVSFGGESSFCQCNSSSFRKNKVYVNIYSQSWKMAH